LPNMVAPAPTARMYGGSLSLATAAPLRHCALTATAVDVVCPSIAASQKADR
jgi:hypothetical protein